ncbi:Uncharacterized protein Adt_10909 [Abeliophyllum distichum]|uniref:Uncharacterized protein n=1 Tax=Abeliophyllum distichum TaxID=126358 RepID=A0ABD1ULD0_9LAMI
MSQNYSRPYSFYFRLEDCGIRLYTTKKIPHIDEYNSVEACRHVTGKHFETPALLSTNQLTLTCCVLHNIIAHIIVPQKGHHDEVNHYDVFLFNSILLGHKLDFPYIMLQHMNSVLSGTRSKALPYGMILTKVFEHFEVSIHDLIALFSKATDTINISTLKRMQIFKDDGQWVAKSKGFDDELGPFTLPFEGGKEMDKMRMSNRQDHDQIGHRPPLLALPSPIIITICLMAGLTPSSTEEGLRNTMGTLQASVDGMTTLLQALYSRLDVVLPPHPPPEN